jgi:F-type H+-transporting ATPase subunit b
MHTIWFGAFTPVAMAQEGDEGAIPEGVQAHEGAASGHGGEHSAPALDIGKVAIQGINLAIFLGILVYFARRPILDSLANRANNVRRELDEAARMRDEAEARYREIEEKLATLDKRIADLKEDAQRDADADAARIAERAEADAARLKETAERTIREEAARARSEIRREVVEQAAALARETVRQNVGPDDQSRLQGEFMRSVAGQANGKSGGEA